MRILGLFTLSFKHSIYFLLTLSWVNGNRFNLHHNVFLFLIRDDGQIPVTLKSWGRQIIITFFIHVLHKTGRWYCETCGQYAVTFCYLCYVLKPIRTQNLKSADVLSVTFGKRIKFKAFYFWGSNSSFAGTSLSQKYISLSYFRSILEYT